MYGGQERSNNKHSQTNYGSKPNVVGNRVGKPKAEQQERVEQC
jgi:hypothetical protein